MPVVYYRADKSSNTFSTALVSETHLVNSNQVGKFHGYSTLLLPSSGNPRERALILVNNRIKHNDIDIYVTDSIQLSMITVHLLGAKINTGSIYVHRRTQ